MVISKQLENMNEEIPDLVQHFACVPRMSTPNPADIPLLLRDAGGPRDGGGGQAAHGRQAPREEHGGAAEARARAQRRGGEPGGDVQRDVGRPAQGHPRQQVRGQVQAAEHTEPAVQSVSLGAQRSESTVRTDVRRQHGLGVPQPVPSWQERQTEAMHVEMRHRRKRRTVEAKPSADMNMEKRVLAPNDREREADSSRECGQRRCMASSP
ncbi:hypothetical protein ON010_g4386 [Phytophthora cinnamomi]|nr:hypothetical protein ON010_g4386 [Phytophthora cinnamomi]